MAVARCTAEIPRFAPIVTKIGDGDCAHEAVSLVDLCAQLAAA